MREQVLLAGAYGRRIRQKALFVILLDVRCFGDTFSGPVIVRKARSADEAI